MPWKPPLPEPEMLIARIENFEQTYFISEHREHREPVADEALIEINGRIETITPRHKHHLHRPVAITLACAASFQTEGRTLASNDPYLVSVNLRRDRCSLMAYLPAHAFWAIPAMIDNGRATHIEARFSPTRYGSGELLSIHLVPQSKLAESGAC